MSRVNPSGRNAAMGRNHQFLPSVSSRDRDLFPGVSRRDRTARRAAAALTLEVSRRPSRVAQNGDNRRCERR